MSFVVSSLGWWVSTCGHHCESFDLNSSIVSSESAVSLQGGAKRSAQDQVDRSGVATVGDGPMVQVESSSLMGANSEPYRKRVTRGQRRIGVEASEERRTEKAGSLPLSPP